MRIDYRNEYLDLATDEGRRSCEEFLNTQSCVHPWGKLQQAFLSITDRYLEDELEKPVDANIGNHEAGGQWRIAFPHLQVRGEIPGIENRIAETMAARRRYSSANLYHGFPDCAEVHHEIETFLYFQLPLFHSGLPGHDEALASIEDVAHHAGNWIDGVPAWYDWGSRRFVSIWLGTREVKDFAPYDYQEANHFRFIDVVLAAYLGTKEQRYLDLAIGYGEMWCEHIEGCAIRGEPIRCSILPPGVDVSEMGRSGKRRDDNLDRYVIFYGTVSTNTAYDIVMALQDLFIITGEERFLRACRLMTDQFFEHGEGGRPAAKFSDGAWRQFETPAELSRYSYLGDAQGVTFLSHMALRHDIITGTDHYRDIIVRWAGEIDEVSIRSDQMSPDLLSAAHYYDGDPRWLERAYAMTLRTAAVLEPLDNYNQCGGANRQASRYLMQHLYLPILGGCDWGIRGNLPVRGFRHESERGQGLPVDTAFRCWRGKCGSFLFEAVNSGEAPAEWRIIGAPVSAPVEIALGPGGTAAGNLAGSD